MGLNLMAVKAGAKDMAGNVWEWVNDWYDRDNYTILPADNPEGPGSGDFKVLRGGGWYNSSFNLRGANRSGDGPAGRRSNIGFRCVLPGG